MPEILKDVRLFCGGLDLTGRNNKIDSSAEVEEKNVTTWANYDPATGSIWKAVLGGLAQMDLSASGFQDGGVVDEALWNQLGGLGAWTAFPDSADVGAVAWLINAMEGSYKTFTQIGDVHPWEAGVKTTWPAARGVGLHPPGTARTATGSGAAVEHVAVAAGQYLYAALHVISVAGTDTPTLTVTVESDVNDTFAGPATQITFDAAVAVDGQILRAAGPLTDTFYRANWTITGTDPSFLFVVSLGVK